MSMTGKTTNELLPIGLGTDVVSIFDINPICEKIDNLINELQTKENVDATDITALKQSVTTLTQSVTEATQTASTNASAILQLQSSINGLTTALENYLKISELSSKLTTATCSVKTVTIAGNDTANVEIDVTKEGYYALGVIGWAVGSANPIVTKVECSAGSNLAYMKIKNTVSSTLTCSARVTVLYLAK